MAPPSPGLLSIPYGALGLLNTPVKTLAKNRPEPGTGHTKGVVSDGGRVGGEDLTARADRRQIIDDQVAVVEVHRRGLGGGQGFF